MANSFCLMSAWLLFCVLTLKEVKSIAAAADGGACASRVEIYGYICEEHTVTTEDGYILSIQRIPNGRWGSPSEAAKPPVLLQHGLMMDGVTWMLNSPDESLAYILADEGFDVWIVNSRGTVYSLGHTSLSSSDPDYWNWSWDELAAYDLPATVGYVYQQTGQQKIHYVGHSLGTLTAIVEISQQNLLNMLRSAALLGPIAYMDQVPSIIARGAAKTYAAEAIYKLGVYQFDPNGKAVHDILAKLCNLPGADCLDKLTTFTGKNCCLNSSAVELYMDHEPQSTATKNIIHLSQMIRTGTVTKYDYNNDNQNIKFYGQPIPPAYNVSAIPTDFPLFFSYGGTDKLSDAKDVLHLLDSLKSHYSDKMTVQYVDNYAHADFVMAVNAKQVVYDPMMAFFKLH